MQVGNYFTISRLQCNKLSEQKKLKKVLDRLKRMYYNLSVIK